jgi:hypothetical protein
MRVLVQDFRVGRSIDSKLADSFNILPEPYSTKMRVRASSSAASRCLTSAVTKGMVRPKAVWNVSAAQASVQQVNEQVNVLMSYRQAGSLDGATMEVETFTDVFNAFLSQVEEIKK